MRQVYQMTFAAENVSLALAETAAAALEAARGQKPDLIIVDATLPDQSGYALCSALKGEASLAGVPVVLMASQHQAYDAGQGDANGVDAHAVKPYDSTKFLALVQETLEKAQVAAGADDFDDADEETSAGVLPPEVRASMKPSSPSMKRPQTASFDSPIDDDAPLSIDPGEPELDVAFDDVPQPAAAPPPAQGGVLGSVAERLGSLRKSLTPAARKTTASSFPPPAHPSSNPPAAMPTDSDSISPTTGFAPVAASAPPAAHSAASINAAASNNAAVDDSQTNPPASTSGALAGLEARLASLSLDQAQIDGVLAISKDVIERVVWEVVPELAEAMVREEIKRLTQ